MHEVQILGISNPKTPKPQNPILLWRIRKFAY